MGVSHRRAAARSNDAPVDNPRQLGDFMWTTYQTTRPRDPSLLDEAIRATQLAVDIDHELDDRAQLLFNLGARLHARFRLTGTLDDLEKEIPAFQRAVELTPDGDQNQIERLSWLGVALHTRFECIGELNDLNYAMTVCCCVVELAPDTHPSKPGFMNDYGHSLMMRFTRLGDFADIESAIAILRRANHLASEGHLLKALCSNGLGNALLSRYYITRVFEDLEQVISLRCCAAELWPDDHPDKPLFFSSLGASYLERFKCTGELEDMERAISSHRRAVDLTPDGHLNKAQQLNDLGDSFLMRFEHTRELEDISQAISMHSRSVEITLDGHSAKPSYLNKLGNLFTTRFRRTGDLEDLKQSVSAHRRAIELMPDGYADGPLLLSNLGTSFLMTFERTLELDALDQAIMYHRRAVELGCADKPALFGNLGLSLYARFKCTEDFEDLKQAISFHRRAVELVPDDDAEKPSLFNSLGVALSMRFEQMRMPEDLKETIFYYRRAVKLAADDHPLKPLILRNLCYQLGIQYEQTHELSDIQEAMSIGRRAIELTPIGHPSRFGQHSALAICFRRRFKHYGDVNDLMEAIPLYKQAVELVANNDPRLSDLHWDLCNAQMDLFALTLAQTDFDAAVESCVRSIMHPSGYLYARFMSARHCIRLLSDYPSFSTTDSLLSAHSRVIAILPEIVWLGHDIHRRYKDSSQLREHVNIAVADAVAAGALERAVEWLEAGRALIWAQILALRTPLDELEDSYPDLVESLRSVQQHLRSSAHSTFAPDIDDFGGIAGLTVNTAADNHRTAAIEYDKLMKKIRECPRYEDFLRPRAFDSLFTSIRLLSGPVVFINATSSRCDALLLSPEGALVSVVLPDLSLEKAAGLCNTWISRLINRMGRERGLVPPNQLGGYLNPFTLVLERLWLWVVSPVLVALDLTTLIKNGRLPHITWCPTGPLAYLPLHAAGIYSDRLGPRVFDFVVSSYTPSLTALLRACSGAEPHHSTPEVLLVTQPATPDQSPLPGTARESAGLLSALATSDIRSTILDDKDATVGAVHAAMSQHPWVHLACHGTQDIDGDPTQSAFLLQDGRLSLATLMGTVSDNAEVAFLSACQTAVGDIKNPEESAHLAAGMLAVGFKGVVGTTWSIRDDDAPVVVEAFYKELLALRSAGTLGQGETGAAYALHEAMRVLRETVGENSFMRWVPFVHFGV